VNAGHEKLPTIGPRKTVDTAAAVSPGPQHTFRARVVFVGSTRVLGEYQRGVCSRVGGSTLV